MKVKVVDETKENGSLDLTAQLSNTFSGRTAMDTIHVKGKDAGQYFMSFQRTIRVPDNTDENYLPPGLGTFPLYSVSTYKDSLPPEIAAKGGIFFPMYQREAMWINFESTRPFAIKLFLGGVNALSGEPLQDNAASLMRRLTRIAKNEPIQDYVVTPKQQWIDGIASQAGTVRQFVAMPLGSGYSVEAQITGKEVTGGLQFLVVPSHFDPPNPPIRALDAGASSAPYVPKKLGNWRLMIKILTDETLAFELSGEENTILDVKYMIDETQGIPMHKQRLIYAGKQLEDERKLDDYCISNDSVLHLVLRLRGGGGGPGPDPEIGIAAGGRIKQCIIEDDHPASIWHLDRALSFHVQILNSELFRRVTGVDPPTTPVSAESYAKNGLPFFDIYNEKSNIKGDFEAVKSVKAIDKMKAQEKGEEVADEPSVENPVILLNPDGSRLSFKPVSVMKEELSGINHAQF